MWKISLSTIKDACAAAKNYYPDEFMCFLGGNEKKNIINEIVLVPTTNGEEFSSVWEGVIPIDKSILGSLHSHPGSSARPSEEDKKFFQKYSINVIIGGRFEQNDCRFYDNRANPLKIEITD